MAGSTSRDTSPPRVNEARQYLSLLALPVLGLLGWFGGQPLTITLIYGTTWAAYAVNSVACCS